MKLTKNKWLNFIILKIAEGLGIALFCCLIVGFILLLIANPAIIPYIEWAWNVFAIIVGIFAVGFISIVVVMANLKWAEKLKRDK